MHMDKPRVIKDYEKLDEEIQQQIKLVYPYGYSRNLITFTNKEGKKVSALPFETDEKYYLVRMTVQEAREIIDSDDDYNDDGELRDGAKEAYEDKFSDVDYLADVLPDEEDEMSDQEDDESEEED